MEGLFKCVYFADVDLLCITGYQCINNVLYDACDDAYGWCYCCVCVKYVYRCV